MSDQTKQNYALPCNSLKGTASEKSRVLVVDDDDSVRGFLLECLEDAGYETFSATNGREALWLLSLTGADLVLSDLRMPGMDGIEFLGALAYHANATGRPTGILLLTGCDDVSLAVKAMQLGALNYLLKPASPEQIEEAVAKALSQHRRNVEIASLQQERIWAADAKAQECIVRQKQLAGLSEHTLAGLVQMLDIRERESVSHSQVVSRIALRLSQAIGLEESACETVCRGTLVHDIGKMDMPDDLLREARPSEVERGIIERHPEKGYLMLQHIPGWQEAAELVLAHHERYDGSGYPNRLSGHKIPLGARIFAVADYFESLASDRPGWLGCSYPEATEQLVTAAGSWLDPAIVGRFLAITPAFWEDMRAKILDYSRIRDLPFTSSSSLSHSSR